MTKEQLLNALESTLNTEISALEVTRIRRKYINEASYYFPNAEEIACNYLADVNLTSEVEITSQQVKNV